jgi:BA14K-like protein
MKRLGVFATTALSLSLAIATPALAQQTRGHSAGGHAAGTTGARIGGIGAQANFRGARTTNVGRSNFAGRGNAQFAQGAYRGGQFRGDRGFGRNVGLAGAAAVGIATGAAVGGYGYGYSDPYYGDNYAYGPDYDDSYAYDNGATFSTGLPVVTFNPVEVDQGPVDVSGDASYCAQRYRSYDPASGTYLGFDGLRHPCL